MLLFGTAYPHAVYPLTARLLSAEKAAAYLDVSRSHFLAAIAPEGLLIHLDGRLKGWLHKDLNAWR